MNLMNTDMNLQMLFLYDTSIAMMMSVANEVRDLHSCGLLHKDLKSTNVLLAPNKGWMDSGFTKTADFEMGGAASTGFWSAPEVLRAVKDGVRPILTWETDVYGFAMVCYEILTGYFPFQGYQLSDYEIVLSGQRPQLPNNLTAMLWKLLCSCWDSNPRNRPTFSDIVGNLKDEYDRLIVGNSEAYQQSEEFRIRSGPEVWSLQLEMLDKIPTIIQTRVTERAVILTTTQTSHQCSLLMPGEWHLEMLDQVGLPLPGRIGMHHLGMKGQYLHLAHPIIDPNYMQVLEDQRSQ